MPRRPSSSESACTRRTAMLAPSARSLSMMSTWRTSGPDSVRCFMSLSPSSSKTTECGSAGYARRGRARLHLIASDASAQRSLQGVPAMPIVSARRGSEARAQRESVGAGLVEERLPARIVEEVEQPRDLHDVLVEQVPPPQCDLEGV